MQQYSLIEALLVIECTCRNWRVPPQSLHKSILYEWALIIADPWFSFCPRLGLAWGSCCAMVGSFDGFIADVLW